MVKTLRTLVLLLVCVLLPLRVAVGATMLCAEPGQAGERTVAVGHAHHGMHGGDHAHDVDAHADHGPADNRAAGADDGAKADSCHLCASGCNAAAMVTALPSVPGAPPVASTVFQALDEPVPDFESEGQDRPPRAI